MSQAGENSGASGGTEIVTILGDTGSITGATVTIYANNATRNSGATVKFVNSGTISTFNVTDGNSNTLIGKLAGGASISSGALNTGIGFQALKSVTTCSGNTAIGANTLSSNSLANNNIAIGSNALNLLNVSGATLNVAIGDDCLKLSTADGSNVGVGADCLSTLNGGSFNVCMGRLCANHLATGGFNVLIGFNSGISYTGAESSNIILNSDGVLGESNVLRLGNTTGTGNRGINSAYIQGIFGQNAVGFSAPKPVFIDSITGQLGISNTSASEWVDSSINFLATPGTGYFVTATLTATMPASASQGDTVAFVVDAAATLTVLANTGQFLRIAAVVSASSGTAVNTARGDSVTFVFRASDSTWIATSVIGNWVVT